MSFGAVVDVAIGLIFIYLLLGLIGSAAQEAVASVLNWRGKHLQQGLKALLAHGGFAGKASDWLYDEVSSHGMLTSAGGSRSPSYIAAGSFATAMLETLMDGSQAPLFTQVENRVAQLPAGRLRQALVALLNQAGGDLDKFRGGLERWFDEAMDRVSGAYKRFTQYFMLVFGLLIAFGGNFDTIEMTRVLWRDPVLRAQAVEQAKAYVDAHPQTPLAAATAASAAAEMASAPASAAAADPLATTQAKLQALKAQSASSLAAIDQLKLPFGWPQGFELCALLSVSKLLGCLMTALAVALGAPFWFDTLQKFLNLRAAGPKPAKA